jgi:hypothetical protein
MAIVRAGIVLVVAAFATSCGGSTGTLDAAALSPVGMWSFTQIWGTGTCGLTGMTELGEQVIASSTGYVLVNADPSNVQVTATFHCTASHCELSFTETEMGMSGTTRVTMDLTLDAMNHITGTGQFASSPTGGTMCTQAFSVMTGMKE